MENLLSKTAASVLQTCVQYLREASPVALFFSIARQHAGAFVRAAARAVLLWKCDPSCTITAGESPAGTPLCEAYNGTTTRHAAKSAFYSDDT